MSEPIGAGDLAELLDALGDHEGAATLRWSETPADRRHESEVSALRAQLAAAEDELQHATAENDRLAAAMCKRCIAKLDDKDRAVAT